MRRVQVAFYGDDFTGSSENLAQYHRSGVRARLYLEVPTVDELDRDVLDFDVLGLAGTARALAPAEMADELRPAFKALARVQAPLFQYKICSTFDSAASVGSFGVAMDVADDIFGPSLKAVYAATPDFGRYTAFGQHFARFGNEVFRLDRHPSMSAHPKTPMDESDLIRHLAKQTSREFVGATLPTLRSDGGLEAFVAQAASVNKGVVFDGVDNADSAVVAACLWKLTQSSRVSAFAAQGLAQALGRWLVANGVVRVSKAPVVRIPKVETLVVLSGSCAIQNGRQIDAAEQAGWGMIKLDPAAAADPRQRERARAEIETRLLDNLTRKQPTVVYTARGTDGRIDADEVPAETLGAIYGGLVQDLRKMSNLRRVVFAGGDSSSFSVKASGARALEIAVFDELQNSHVCRLSAPEGHPMNGLEVMLKGGQIGAEDFFLRAMAGTE